jgi:hypothetical protein
MPATRILSVTDLPCFRAPIADPPATHHLVPFKNEMTCAYCQQTEAQIRAATPLLHRPIPCTCNSCLRSPSPRLCICHNVIEVHR